MTVFQLISNADFKREGAAAVSMFLESVWLQELLLTQSGKGLS